MDQLLEFAANHPILVGAALIMTGVVAYNEARLRSRGVTALDPGEATRVINAGAVVVDVRSPEQFAAGHIVNARNVPLEQIDERPKSLQKLHNKPVLTCCEAGPVASRAAAMLRKNGFNQVLSLRGGLAAWQRENLPLVKKK